MLSFALASALLISAMLTGGARVIALRLGFVDHPGPRKIHSAPMPLLGGAAMYAAGLLSCLIFMPSWASQREAVGVLTAATMLIVVGMLDDRSLLSSQTKLAIAMPGAAVILLVSGVHAQWPAALLGVENTLFGGAINAVMTVVWVVGITAAMSILDHMDGLCAGAAALASFFFAVLALESGQPLVLTLAAAVLGASPARVWREIDLPITSRALLVGAVFAFTISMGEFGATVFIARPDTPTLPIAIFRFLGQPGALNYGQALAMSTLLMLVCAVGFLIIERFRIGGGAEF